MWGTYEFGFYSDSTQLSICVHKTFVSKISITTTNFFSLGSIQFNYPFIQISYINSSMTYFNLKEIILLVLLYRPAHKPWLRKTFLKNI